MLSVIVCLVGVFILLAISESLNIKGSHKSELIRKFTHISVGIFVAFWPWLISWRAIQIIGIVMVAVVFFNRRVDIFRFNKGLRRETYGDYFFALAITLCALLTTSKVFFAIAIAQLALADGLAAVIGRKYGLKWKYQLLNHTKTLLGTMTFWFISLCVFGFGVLFAQNQVDLNGYRLLIILAPPILALLENASPQGLDNLTIPLAALGALQVAANF
jgi:dolichol kinase